MESLIKIVPTIDSMHKKTTHIEKIFITKFNEYSKLSYRYV